MDKKSRMVLTASVAGLLAAVGSGMWAAGSQAQEGEEAAGPAHCYGINKCKGTGDCGGKGHGCAGMNGCAGAGYIDLDTDDCLRIQGGRLTAEPEAEPAA